MLALCHEACQPPVYMSCHIQSAVGVLTRHFGSNRQFLLDIFCTVNVLCNIGEQRDMNILACVLDSTLTMILFCGIVCLLTMCGLFCCNAASLQQHQKANFGSTILHLFLCRHKPSQTVTSLK